jgi:CRP/FNR family transcriptional regulator, anaerobic regulatory protein
VSASWINEAALPLDCDALCRNALGTLRPQVIPVGHVVFRPGDQAMGFVIVLSGRISVFLTGASGREILLYDVTRGETCVQTTLSLLGDEAYAGEAIAETDVRAVLVPRKLFLELMNQSEWFRHFVFKAFAARISDITNVLEQVAFVKVEQRLVRQLIVMADDAGMVTATHHDLAVAIGSVREVVSRQLEALSKRRLINQERGHVQILDRATLSEMAQENAL